MHHLVKKQYTTTRVHCS